MTFSHIQLRKEVRPLLLPWIMIMLAGVLSLFRFSRVDYSWSWSPIELLNWILPIGCFLAIPLLAAMSLGAELQHGTFTALLAQPIERQKLWLQKTIISVAVVLPPAVLYLFSFNRNQEFNGDFWLAAVWMVASTAGSVAGTLIARSAIGGLALSSAFFGMLFVLWSKLAESNRRGGDLSAGFLSITIIVLLSYSFAMVWLGHKMFFRFQPIESSHGENGLLGANHFFLPRIARDWLRCKPHGAFLNLIRREFHLLHTVWLLALVSLATWILLILFHFVRPNADEFSRAPIPAGLAVILSLLIALLAGSLSLGEEKNSGTHGWQLTMPVSPSAQWVVKLIFALIASVFCAVAIPLGVLVTRGWISGSPFSYLDHTPLWVWFAEALIATLLAFWCSTVLRGTVRSVVWFFPVLIALALSAELGSWMGARVTRLLLPVVDGLLSSVDPFRINRMIATVLDPLHDSVPIFAVLVAPLLALGLIQTHRQFHGQKENRRFHLLRCLLPLFAVLGSSSLLLTTVFSLVAHTRGNELEIVREVHLAIETLSAPSSGTNTMPLQKFSLEDLAKSSQLSEKTKFALRGSTIIVRPDETRLDRHLPPIQWPFEYAFMAVGANGKRPLSYSALIRTPRGSECNLKFWASGFGQNGFLLESCQ